MKLSYAVVLFNNPIYQIEHLIRNIEQTVPSSYDYELFMVNNSPDQIQITQYLESESDQNEHFHVIIPDENKGFGAGNNLAIYKADSDFHIIVNPDVIIPDQNQIQKMVECMIKQKVVVLSPLIKDSEGRVQKLTKHTPSVLDMGLRFLGPSFFARRQKWFTFDDQYDVLHEASNLSGSFLIFDTSVLKSIGGFDERYFLYMEDADIGRSMALHGKTIFYPDAYVIHEWQRQNQKSIRGILRMLSSMVKYFSKWGLKLW